MGSPEGDRDWVDVANDLLCKCDIKLRLRKLTDCTADVFIALYENILGEKVPDYITAPCSQEDNVHNVQSVIDSLSLDYLQISLSHITGENVVRADKESIKNLLEIFDGLLEYLNEELNEESQDGEEPNGSVSDSSPGDKKTSDCGATEEKDTNLEEGSVSSTVESTLQSSKQSLHSWNAEELGSTGEELIGLGVSARTFKSQNEGMTLPPQTLDEGPSPGPVDTEQTPQTAVIHTAIALQPPTQCHGPKPRPQSPSNPSSSNGLGQSHAKEEQTAGAAQTSNFEAEPVTTNGQESPEAVSEKSLTSQQRDSVEVHMKETLEPTNGGPRKVLFRTQPDVLLLTLQDEVVPTPPSLPDREEEELHEDNLNYTQGFKDRRTGQDNTDQSYRRALEEHLLYRRQRNKQTEEELHHLSENLSHRLEKLDQMLKRVLSESGESSEIMTPDHPSHYSNGHVDCHTEHTGVGDAAPSHRSQSPSPPTPPVGHTQEQVDDTGVDSLCQSDKRQADLKAFDHSRRIEQRHRLSHRKTSKHLKNKFYKEELKRYEEEEQTALDWERLKAQEAEREYREAILGDISPRGSPSNAKVRPKLQKPHQTRRKAPPLKVNENNLLPLLREELPHLHISSHALGRMWEQQMQQVDRLHSVSSSHSQRRSKLSSQLEESQRKYDLLLELVRKDKEHSRRLRDFKDRIQQQKSTQNRLREQRQQVARAKKYHNDYHVQHRARLMKDRTKEERMFRQLFEEGLELQKVRLREQRAFAKEQRQEQHRRHQDQIKSMENYYKDQFSLLAEKLAQERQDIQVRKMAQEKALMKMKRELRSRMEREIGELQKIVIQNNEDDYFEDLEVQRLRSRLQMASFHYNTSYLH